MGRILVLSYDLIVVGGGPGGLMAARTAVEDGMKVLLIERKHDITEINRACLQIVYIRPISPLAGGKTFNEPISVESFAERAVLHFPNLGFSVDYDGPLRPYLNWIQISPGGNRLHRWKPNDKIFGYLFQKEIFVAGLLASIPKTGVDILTGTAATGAELTPNGVKVSFRDKSGEQTVESRAAIVADGINSKVVESLGFNQKRQVLMPGMKGQMHVVNGLESDLPLDCSLVSYSIPAIDTNANVIIGMMANNMNSIGCGAAPYTVFKDNPILAPLLANARLVQTRAFNHTVRTPIKEPVTGNVVVIGDAAAPAETHMAGAVACGWQAVKAIIKELNGERAYPEYVAWWQRSFAFNQPDYFKIVSDYYAWNRVCANEDIDFIFDLFQNTPGIPTVLIEENMELIKRYRPELHEKLIGRKEESMWGK
jgi:digeranylgeranylglycerophospholipid reductase